jgi:hypothetical protein
MINATILKKRLFEWELELNTNYHGYKKFAKKVIQDIKDKAIELGYAEYNQTSGQWQWKDKK